MVRVLASCVISRVFEPRSGQTRDYKIGICCFSAKHSDLRSKNKDWLAHNQDKKIMYPSGATCLPMVCCFGELVA